MKELVRKWIVEYTIYENGEPSFTNIATYRLKNDEKDIYFDTEEEAKEYADSRSCEFAIYHASEADVNESNGVNYKIVKAEWTEEAERKRLYLKPCPFCGKTPKRNETFAECETCGFKIDSIKWNTRKYH